MRLQVKHVILDRDGVLNVERSDGGYIDSWSQWRWLSGALEGLALLSSAGIRISVATNQSGVGRGLIARGELDAIHARMIKEATREGGVIDHVFVCPHVPNGGCGCRKPLPGLLQSAFAETRIPKRATLALGDDLRDLEAAWAADISAALVRTGKGHLTEAAIAHTGVPVFENLREFAGAVVTNTVTRAKSSVL